MLIYYIIYGIYSTVQQSSECWTKQISSRDIVIGKEVISPFSYKVEIFAFEFSN